MDRRRITLKKPNPLKRGDTIGIVAPSSPYKEELLQKGITYLKSLGFNVYCNLKTEDFQSYLAASDKLRANSIHEMFLNQDIKGIFCVRGGYGALRLIPLLDEEIICNNPKLFMGYSDITTLLLFFLTRCKMISFYGPMVSGDFGSEEVSPFTKEKFIEAITTTSPLSEIKMDKHDLFVIKKGNPQRGRLIGGCLSLFIHSLGTPLEPDTRESILFFEDVGEEAYKIDRMITHLKLAGKFNGVKGLIFGKMENCKNLDLDRLKKIIDEVLEDLDIPILANFPFGHGKDKVVIPIGVEAEIDNLGLKFLESGLSL